MGLWQEVVLTTSGPVTIEYLFFSSIKKIMFVFVYIQKNSFTHFIYPLVDTNLISLEEAELTVLAELANYASTYVTGTLTVTISELGSCTQNIALSGNSVEQVLFVNSFCPILKVKNPKLWWPAQMGTPCIFKEKSDKTFYNYNNLIMTF